MNYPSDDGTYKTAIEICGCAWAEMTKTLGFNVYYTSSDVHTWLVKHNKLPKYIQDGHGSTSICLHAHYSANWDVIQHKDYCVSVYNTKRKALTRGYRRCQTKRNMKLPNPDKRMNMELRIKRENEKIKQEQEKTTMLLTKFQDENGELASRWIPTVTPMLEQPEQLEQPVANTPYRRLTAIELRLNAIENILNNILDILTQPQKDKHNLFAKTNGKDPEPNPLDMDHWV